LFRTPKGTKKKSLTLSGRQRGMGGNQSVEKLEEFFTYKGDRRQSPFTKKKKKFSSSFKGGEEEKQYPLNCWMLKNKKPLATGEGGRGSPRKAKKKKCSVHRGKASGQSQKKADRFHRRVKGGGRKTVITS